MPSTITIPNAIIGYLPDGRAVYEIRGGAPDPEDPPADPPASDDPPADPPSEDEDGDVDDKVKAKLSKLRNEAAGWRTQVRDLQKQLEAAVKPEDVERIKTELGDQLAAKDRALVIERHKLPAELAALIPEKGKTADEMEALAKGLAKYVVPGDDDADLDGGLAPGKGGGEATDPASLAKRVRGARPRFH